MNLQEILELSRPVSDPEVILFLPGCRDMDVLGIKTPLSVLHLHSYLKNNTDVNSIFVDGFSGVDIPAVIDSLKKPPVCFCISTMTGYQIKSGLDIARQVRAKFPQAPIVWGGWHPTLLADQCLENEFVDYVIRGQGELALARLAGALRHKRPDLSTVPNLSYKNGETVVHNQSHGMLDFLKDLRIDYSEFAAEKYLFKAHGKERIITMITSLGCPFKCAFCAMVHVYQQKVIYRDTDIVLDEIEWLVKEKKLAHIELLDDNFFINEQRTREFCEKLIERRLNITWDAAAHAALLLKAFSRETMEIVRESGCIDIYVGAESGSEDMLKRLDKKLTIQNIHDFVKMMKDVGISPTLSTMISFPVEGSDDVIQTMKLLVECREINPDLGYKMFYFTPYPGTRMYEDALNMGMKCPGSMEEWEDHSFYYLDPPWTKKSIRRLVLWFVAYFYPYSVKQKMGASRIKYLLRKILHPIARWRVRNWNFKFPVDAMLVAWMRRNDPSIKDFVLTRHKF